VAPSVASASQLVARNTSTERLAVSVDGKALLTCHGEGRLRRVLAWGATNARQPAQVVEQTEVRVDYSGLQRQLMSASAALPLLDRQVTACNLPSAPAPTLEARRM
jgi:hypothetical protein